MVIISRMRPHIKKLLLCNLIGAICMLIYAAIGQISQRVQHENSKGLNSFEFSWYIRGTYVNVSVTMEAQNCLRMMG